MNKSQLAIGVFDSGMGGLTVLSALRGILPLESFIYLGDTARLPYGTKSPHTVKQYAVQMARLLVERRIKALVIACNTATTAALSHLQTILADIPVVGVIAPGAAAAVAASQNQKIAVWATETTIASEAYQSLIKKDLPQVRIQAQACSLLVALAEEGMVDNAIAKTSLAHYLENWRDEDTLVLGCTHFPVFTPLLTRLLPANVRVVDSAKATAIALQALLAKENLLQLDKTTAVNTHYLVTDSKERFQRVGERFLNAELSVGDIELIDV